MTCREKFIAEHPYSNIDDWCPDDFGYLPEPECCDCACTSCAKHGSCGECWDREIPEEEDVSMSPLECLFGPGFPKKRDNSSVKTLDDIVKEACELNPEIDFDELIEAIKTLDELLNKPTLEFGLNTEPFTVGGYKFEPDGKGGGKMTYAGYEKDKSKEDKGMFMFVYKHLDSYDRHDFEIYDACDINDAIGIFYSETVDYEHINVDLFCKIIEPLSVEEKVKTYNELAIGHYELITIYTGLTEVFSREDDDEEWEN